MLTREFAEHFAQDWIESWNSHDLDRILEHYTDDFEMTSPLIVTMMSIPSGTIKGKPGVRAYWAKGLERNQDLKFKLHEITYGVESIALYYDSIAGKRSVEWFLFGDAGKVIKSIAHYNDL